MRHLGDITKLNGADVPPVDVVTGGSPCQDLSVAGKRAGLAGERSGLFMEQIRVIKEMRNEDVRRGRAGEFVRPRFMVWENVPGAFSSNSGKDFAAVLEETVRIVCKEAPAVPVPEGGWPHAGCLSGVGDGGVPFSVAWRLHDAQFWGVPQRRKRIALVADFGGLSAPEILFERKGLSGDSEPGGAAREEAAGSTGNGAESAGGWGIAHALTARYDGSPQPDKGNGANIVCGNPWDAQTQRAYVGDGAWHSLNANESGGQSRDALLAAGFKAGHNPHSGIYEADTSRTLDNNGGNPACNQGGIAVVTAGFDEHQSADAGNIGYKEEQGITINTTGGGDVLQWRVISETGESNV